MLTVQDSVPFWDCSEFSAAAILQQVPHPPGAPLFLMIGKLFDVLIPFGDPGWKLNLLSVFSSAFTIWLLYQITVMVINNMTGRKPRNTGEIVSVCGSALIGALAFTFSDTFWFNAVESEVYALSTLFVAVVIFLLMKWNEKADEPGHERYLLLIMYVIGLAIGVHLLAVLAIFGIGLIIYFRKYTGGNDFKMNSKFFIASGVILVGFFAVYPFTVMWIPALLAGNFPIKNEAQDYLIYDSTALTVLTIGLIAFIAYLFFNSYQKGKNVLALLTMAFLFSLMGYTTYTHIIIRSNSNPPMNENEPKDFKELARYIGREQYGNDDSWPRRVKSGDEAHFVANYRQRDADGEYTYGEWFEPKPEYAVNRWGREIPYNTWPKINTLGELAYMWKFQMNHMYFRYLLWNFAGRNSDEQDAGSNFLPFQGEVQAEQMNWDTGYEHLFPISFFAIPLLVGLFGLIFHFYRDPKVAFSFLIMFLMMGVLMALAQKQQDPQPRERDYFYTGSFMIFAMWIGIGAFGLIEKLTKEKLQMGVAAGVLAVMLLGIPVNMAANGWAMHDRTGNYIPFDYSYNILQSCEEDAILFTYGDNDTFPLWYLQDVMGVRRDIRIVNLSLANTIWYVDQLKNREPWGTEKIPLDFSDEKLSLRDELHPDAPAPDLMPQKVIKIDGISEEIMREFDPSWRGGEGTFEAVVEGSRKREYQGQTYYVYRVQDQVVHDIIKNTKFKRPVYYSNTVVPDGYAGLQDYFRYEGMAMRVCPVKQTNIGSNQVDLDVMEQCLLNIDNTENFSQTPQYGFKMRNLSNPDVYYDPVHRRLMNSYRLLYLSYARAILDETGDEQKVKEIFSVMDENISPEQFPRDIQLILQSVMMLDEGGMTEMAKEYALDGVQKTDYMLRNNFSQRGLLASEIAGRSWGPHRYKAKFHEILGETDKAIAVLEELSKKSEEYLNLLIQQRRLSMENEEVQRAGFVKYSIISAKEELRIDKLIREGKMAEAKAFADSVALDFSKSNDPNVRYLAREMQKKSMSINVVQDNTEVAQEEEPAL
ncbi:MAG: DUF2723 domain-containing protein [Candidatus Kapaibacteriales bacterium]